MGNSNNKREDENGKVENSGAKRQGLVQRGESSTSLDSVTKSHARSAGTRNAIRMAEDAIFPTVVKIYIRIYCGFGVRPLGAFEKRISVENCTGKRYLGAWPNAVLMRNSEALGGVARFV